MSTLHRKRRRGFGVIRNVLTMPPLGGGAVPQKVNELKQNAAALAETSQKQDEVHKELIAALATTQSPDLIGEWSGLIGTAQTLLPDWVLNPDAFLGEIVKYLVDKGIRDAVLDCLLTETRLPGRLGLWRTKLSWQ